MSNESSNSNLAEFAKESIEISTPAATKGVNDLMAKIFRTRGGRIGSGMGTVIEALWGYYINNMFLQDPALGFELSWIYEQKYNDFACVRREVEWDPSTRVGEILRVEVKSMVASADESKAHFDRLQHEFLANDLLAVFLWDWKSETPNSRIVYPAIVDQYVGPALPIAILRDKLHELRGGTFVIKGNCPDNCAPTNCPHIGEPLNAAGVRERRTGPESSRGTRVSYAANFGGLLRMLGSRKKEGEIFLKEQNESNCEVMPFIEFMARNFERVRKTLG